MPSNERIPLRVRLCFSVGHFQNDLMASMWFSYLLVYLQQVRGFSSMYSGTLLLIGQVVDGLATPLVGYEADVTNGCCGYTKRKSWHLFGTLCTTISFPFIFCPALGANSKTPEFALFIYYAAFVIVFQIGWACVQISHLSLIPEFTSDKSELAGLNGWRYAGTGAANLTTYALVWIILSTKGSVVDTHQVTKDDSHDFMKLAILVTLLGIMASAVFHFGVPEVRRHTMREEVIPSPGQAKKNYGANGSSVVHETEMAATPSVERSGVGSNHRRVRDWLKDFKFYQVALVYMCSRLYVNISQVYLILYVTHTIKLDKVTIAIVPLACYANSFVTSVVLKILDKQFGRYLTYSAGLVIGIGASVFIYFIPEQIAWMVYVAAAMMGIGGALVLVTSLSFAADLIGRYTSSSAFVFGAMSFTDKLSNGIAVEIIESIRADIICDSACGLFYRYVQSFVPGGSAVVAIIGLCALAFSFGHVSSQGIQKYRHSLLKSSSVYTLTSEPQTSIPKQLHRPTDVNNGQTKVISLYEGNENGLSTEVPNESVCLQTRL